MSSSNAPCRCCESQGADLLNDAQLTRCPVCGVGRQDASAEGQPRTFTPTEAGRDCAPLQRWEDEGGQYGAVDQADVEATRYEHTPAGLD